MNETNERESVWFVLFKDSFIRTDSVANDPSLAITEFISLKPTAQNLITYIKVTGLLKKIFVSD